MGAVCPERDRAYWAGEGAGTKAGGAPHQHTSASRQLASLDQSPESVTHLLELVRLKAEAGD